MIFVDTGAWFSLAVQEDSDHQNALDWLDGNEEVLITSDYVIVETINLLRFRDKTRRGHDLACEWAQKLWSGELALVYQVAPSHRQRAIDIFKRYDDKVFSFTDCTSFALMEAEGIQIAFAFDHNFDQYIGLRREP